MWLWLYQRIILLTLNKPYAGGSMPLPFPAAVLCKKAITTKRPTWLCHGFTSYEQTEWLLNSLLVKRISGLVWICGKICGYDRTGERFCWPSISPMRKHASTFPRSSAMQKGYNQEKANMVVSRLYFLPANWAVAYHMLNDRSPQQGINFDWWSF